MVYIRVFEPTDLEPLVQLINAADRIDQTGMRTTPEEFQHGLTAGLDQRTFLAEEGGQLVGYIQLALDQAPGIRNYYGYGAVRPDHRRRGTGTALFRFALEYLQRLPTEGTGRARFHQFARLWVPGVEVLLQKLGFEPGKNLCSMRRPHLAGLASPVMPPGYQFRPVSLADAADLAAVYNSAYAWRGDGTVRTAEEMTEEITSPGFQSELFPVAVNPDGRVIGYGYSVRVEGVDESATTGRIYTIAVEGAEQGRGVGRALLWECLSALERVGASEATLSVEADNPTPALGMYERAGFAPWRQSILYGKVIS